MKYFNRLAFISHFNTYNSISAITRMNEFLTLQLPTVEGNGLYIGVKLSPTKICVPSLKLCFSLFNFASFFLFSKILLQFFLLAKRTSQVLLSPLEL